MSDDESDGSRRHYSFDIERAIATWRQFLTRERSVSEEDLKELEAHLRDEIAHLRRPGMSDEEVYRRALQSIGDYASVGNAYRDVFWDKRTGKGRLAHELRWRLGLLRNNVTAASRYFLRHKRSTVVNLLGLTLGITSSFLLLLFAYDELNYDAYHANADNVYRVVYEVRGDEYLNQGLIHPAPLAAALINDFPEITNAFRFSIRYAETLIKHGDTVFYNNNFYFSDESVFDLLSVPLAEGSPEGALTRPFTVILTEKMAEKIFGHTSVVGEILSIKGPWVFNDFEITAVIRDQPHNTHLHFDFLASFSSLDTITPDDMDSWFYMGQLTYVLMNPDTDVEDLKEKSADFLEKNDPRHASFFKARNQTFSYDFQPLTDIHLNSHTEDEVEATGSIQAIYILIVVALIILIGASINYVNLATAMCGQRIQEVGIRKVNGANRWQLTIQFLTESALVVFIAMVLSSLLIIAFLPEFNAFTGKSIQLLSLAVGRPALAFLLFGLLLGVAVGIYPSLLMSSSSPAQALRGQAGEVWSVSATRKGLVVIQFLITVVLISGTLIVGDQLAFMQSNNPGFDTEQVVVVADRGRALRGRSAAFKEELMTSSEVIGSARAGGSLPVTDLIWRLKPAGNENPNMHVPIFPVGPDFVRVVGLDLVLGESLPSDRDSLGFTPVLINRTAASRLGWSEPIGKEFEGFRPVAKVVGVVEDFHFQSLRTEIGPILLLPLSGGGHYYVRVKTSSMSHTLEHIRDTWNTFTTGLPFEYSFLDEAYQTQYQTDVRLAQTLRLFSALAILIACMGLYALAAYSTELRIKEIGIRKVLGASVASIVHLLIRGFNMLVLIAVVLSVPIVYLLADRWLQDFAYRIEFPWSTMLVASIAALVISTGSVLYQTIRSASSNPVDCLRYE